MIRKLEKTEPLPMDLLLLADPSEEIVLDYMARAQCFVLEQKGGIVGVYSLLPTRPGTVELVNVAVAESEQNKGYGKMLIQHAIETSRSQGYVTVELGTGNSSIAQLALYQKCGFRMTHIDRDFFVRHYEEPIFENGIQCVDMVRLSLDL
ncbi:GNAT family N-acetyltransferase [Lysinibacillus odysseyi]|uniref:Acetyltransferase n=1 Tax=Lysinibacillus odysseyi 34hs-1 = NBRC 100172 TaxID=1220589 RepID=A0A0A3IBJ9_9BACI|nr:GNAT family N-acetyltransferase [Lysinibacillus odysseyi]KGR82114.1 acetyltransferase [Lysinibacillus odysseyi 34hs-1 = NBRC 100172]